MRPIYYRKILKTVWPVCFGYIPLGLACGVFAQKAGMRLEQVAGLCLILYAGSGQFISIAMMMQGATVFSIAATVFVVNLRHFLFSSSLLKYLKARPAAFLAAYAHEITDESFAVNLAAFERGDWRPEEAVRVNVIAHLTWTVSNVLGFIGAGFIFVDTRLVGYALTAMFIGLWSFYLSGLKMLAAGLSAGVLAVLFSLAVGYKLHIVIAAVLTSALFAWQECRQAKRA